MKAIEIRSFISDPLALAITDLPTPSPDHENYVVKIYAVGVNFFDMLQIRGKYQEERPFPWIAGTEFAGIISGVPTPNASKSSYPSTEYRRRFKVGDRVFGSCRGAYATHILVPPENLFHIPAGWSFRDAAGLYVSLPTAYAALVIRGGLHPGEWVLIHAGAGAAGLSAIQISKALGATVIATAGSARKLGVCSKYGADYVVDYRQADWPRQVLDLCEHHRQGNGTKGVDVVIDPVGLIDQSLKCIAWNGRIVLVGFAGGTIEKIAMNRVLLKNVSIIGLHWGPYEQYEPHTVPAVWEEVNRLIAHKRIRGIAFADREFRGLESIPQAPKEVEMRGTWGKVVVELHGSRQPLPSLL